MEVDAHREVVAGVLRRWRVMDPGLSRALALQAVREDIVYPLGGEFGGERADRLRRRWLEGSECIDVTRVQYSLDHPPRQLPPVFRPLLPRARLAAVGVDELVWRVRVEVAADQVLRTRPTVRLERFQDHVQLALALVLVRLERLCVKVNDAERPLLIARLGHRRFEQ